MKTLTQHIKVNKLPLIPLEEKLKVNKDYKGVDGWEGDEEYELTDLVQDVIMYNFALWSDKFGKYPDGKLWKMNKIPMTGYLHVFNTIKGWLKVHNVEKVHCRNVTFIAEPRAYDWLPDELKDRYLKTSNEYHWGTNIKRLCYISDKFAIYAIDNENNTLDIIYWRGTNDITLVCRIHIRRQ